MVYIGGCVGQLLGLTLAAQIDFQNGFYYVAFVTLICLYVSWAGFYINTFFKVFFTAIYGSFLIVRGAGHDEIIGNWPQSYAIPYEPEGNEHVWYLSYLCAMTSLCTLGITIQLYFFKQSEVELDDIEAKKKRFTDQQKVETLQEILQKRLKEQIENEKRR